MKTNVAEFRRFYADNSYWPEGSWIDDWYIEVDGKEIDPDDIDVASGTSTVTVQAQVYFDANDIENSVSLDTFFHHWKKLQTHTKVVLEIPVDSIDCLRQSAKSNKWKVIL